MMDKENSVFLSLTEYFRYLEATPNNRNVIEGEAVLNAGHVIMCGNIAKQASDLGNCKYIIKENNNYELKKKHKYFAQVQVGIAILNLDICHFIIYFSSNNSFIEIKVPFDEEYTYNMLTSLKKKYIEKMLHHICNE
ncbi:uncharacterized protein LOC123676644 [Harmonia axyridis]|uniref:uncharacterized protein LOC123676644 n=1 Tax=Harmonia axyridis TaxID=115357 RepID=UPI001E279835|nr:uncharacterized protein LOC123676644 [Harmonia axyridis]